MAQDNPICPECGTVMSYSRWCGCYTCNNCGNHKGLSQCFCGWRYTRTQTPAPTPPLEDDIGVAKFDGQHWDVEY